MSQVSQTNLEVMLVVEEIISRAKAFLNIIIALLSDERLGCRRRRELIVDYATLYNVGGLSDSKYVRVEEKVCFFLSVSAHHKKNVTVKFDHVRSGHTVSIYFNAVLISLLKLVPILTVTPKPVEDGCTVARWKHFKGCLGALDGTYINVQTPLAHKPRYHNRKGEISVNVLGVVDRNMNFVYMLPGWEGSVADGRVLWDVVSRDNGLKVSTGQYYLCDNGYMNYPGFLAPYRGVRYHLDEWAQGVQHFYPLRTQNRMILACALLHNFIRREMEVDPAEAQIHEDHREFYNDDLLAEVEYVASIDPSSKWGVWRDNHAGEMFNEWTILHMDASGSFTTSCRGRKPVVCRRMWTRPEEDALVQALKEILTSGWKADNGFPVGYLNVLQDKIMKVFLTTGLRAQPHISSKMHAWKKQYNTLYVIFGASGIGWNSTTKMIKTDSDEQWEAACKTEPMARSMRWKSWPYYDSWCEIFGKDRANGNGAEDFHDAFVAEEVATTPVCEPGSGTTTKPASKGKRKLSEGIVGPIMDGLNNFTKKTDSRLRNIIGKMGHEHELTRKCKSVYHIVNEIPDLTLDEKLVATNMIVKNTQVLAMFFSLPQEAKVGQVRLILAGKILCALTLPVGCD
ncbi:hypothetical protein BUALT_Bualt08G0055900 [Buddleja alternifolia]|uniref:DDE Tnp4 domain-containing protein n=1 Tax=Buddleja alternifolia TaxID=168488 RepID=A0AAV6XC13_9LAMI|nr:hypothetical protein BUALT_Bualt08G0055900 [Buddleja alternifolia]